MLLSAAITSSILQSVFGGRQLGAVSVPELIRFVLAVSVCVPGLVCPLVAWQGTHMKMALQRAHEDLRRLALTDQLTGLLNRRGFDQASAEALALMAIRELPVAGFMCDIDFFKRVNDEFGHDFGDAAIRHLAEVLRVVAGAAGAIVGRHGGEEFVVLLPGADRAAALALAERCRLACCGQLVEHESQSTLITVSIGVAVLRRPDFSMAGILKRADCALYEAKRSGRDRVIVWREELTCAA
jgi:diguanylate cyclase (GGDEF)-like protein